MNQRHMKVVVEKRARGWIIRVVESEWTAVESGWLLKQNGYFGPVYETGIGVAAYTSRRAARENLRRYMDQFHYITITGGLH